jgi:hypothetical protein
MTDIGHALDPAPVVKDFGALPTVWSYDSLRLGRS